MHTFDGTAQDNSRSRNETDCLLREGQINTHPRNSLFVSLDVREGEVLGLIGPAKTTLNILSRICKPPPASPKSTAAQAAFWT